MVSVMHNIYITDHQLIINSDVHIDVKELRVHASAVHCVCIYTYHHLQLKYIHRVHLRGTASYCILINAVDQCAYHKQLLMLLLGEMGTAAHADIDTELRGHAEQPGS
eukprot:12194-Heterococcus_DN1.PRE.1